jgi:hypothetical protein
VRELAALQLRTVVWGVLAMGGSAVLVGVMRGSGTVPALLGMAAVAAGAAVGDVAAGTVWPGGGRGRWGCWRCW